MKRIPELDGLRGLAILLVFHYHMVIDTLDQNTYSWAWQLAHYGWTGVDLFFVLSGFLIGGILLDNRDSSTYYKTFYIRRFYRIVPVYVVVLTAVTLSVDTAAISADTVAIPEWAYFGFLQNFFMTEGMGVFSLAPTWSLAVEEQFYLVLPAFIRHIPRRWTTTAVLLCIAGAIVCRLAFYPNMHLTYVLMPCRADALMLGVLAAIVYRNEHAMAWVKRNTHLLYFGLSVLGAGLLYLAFRDYRIGARVFQFGGYSMIAAFYFLFLLLALSDTAVSKVFRVKFLAWFGVLAYGIYLLHRPILQLTHYLVYDREPMAVSWDSFSLTLFAMGVTVLIAKLSWEYFEKPLVALGHNHSYEPAEARATAQ
jgi:peptidoglycan/LPS O-acetylase OafA/YrhL